MLTGEPQVVIGTRSAVFAPLPNLGAIILDEEHDSSFKQDQPAPTYHARTVATWRAELEHCPIVLGSATPSLETWIEHVGDSFTPKQFPTQAAYLSMPRRVRDRPMPIVRVVDLRNELQLGNRSIFSRPLQNALHNLKTTGKQGILFIHRRGHSSFVSCRSCGEVMDCPRCDVSLSYHHTHDQATPTLRCHYCNHQQIQPRACPACGSPYLKFFGSGTQRVMRELDRLCPDLRAIRFDSDTTRRKGAHRAAIARFAAGEADVLVGTQMLTKGLDLPSVSLVGIVAADGLLGMSHYWAAERAFQTLTQVAGRAGRGDDRGQAILQTYQPEHPVVRAVMHHDYLAFIPEDLATRRELGYPPFGRLAIVRVSGGDGAAVQACIERLANVLAADFGVTRTADIVGVPIGSAPASPDRSPDRSSVQLLGPSPAPIERIADRFRWQILLKFPREATIAIDVDRLRAIAPNSVSVELDIDPLQLG
jgi:primosomal protein N' (replication factor Y)